MMNKIENLKGYIMNNVSVGMDLVHEVNSWDGSLEYFQVICMDEFDLIMEGENPSDIAYKIFYGDFNPNDEYFRFNGYGNLESLSDYEVEQEIKDYSLEIARRVVELYEEGSLQYLDDEVVEILEYEEEEGEL